MVGESNQNEFLIQIDASNFAEFEISEFEISRFDCIRYEVGICVARDSVIVIPLKSKLNVLFHVFLSQTFPLKQLLSTHQFLCAGN